ncbi:MAG: DUF814 domain-containing protein [Chitinispirillaceae bacterium]|nr:DUF814 domain-containing protein [Chitinispirillaceae bacterium]
MMEYGQASPSETLQLLRKTLAQRVKKHKHRETKQLAELRESEKAVWYRQMADSLLASPQQEVRGRAQTMVKNIHTQAEERIAINPKFGFKENAQLLYKKARKAQRGAEISASKVARTREEIRLGEELQQECDRALKNGQVVEQEEVCTRIRQYLGEHVPGKKALESNRTVAGLVVPYRRYTIDGWEVYIGKNDLQNDELTTRFARPWDLWLHVAAHSGSHVLIRRKEKKTSIPPEIVEKAAALAAWFSKARHTSYVEVHYTEARYVHKRRRALPGQVILDRFKSLRIAPKSPHDLFPSKYDPAE